MHERYYVELAKQEKLLSRKNEKSDFYNGVFDRYVNPVLTRDMIPLTWRYDQSILYGTSRNQCSHEFRSNLFKRKVLSGCPY